MQQKENEEIKPEYRHNRNGQAPAIFHEVDDPALRHKNRGAIMANIFERYTTADAKGFKQLLSKDFLMMSREMDGYVDRIPKHERGEARKAMMEHLQERGYRES